MAVVPATGYRKTFASEAAAADYDRLLAAAATVVQMPYDEPNEEAFWAAGQEVVRRCDHLIAIWDGEAAAGLGGTADVVQYARQLGREVSVVWPQGAAREKRGTQ
ncbi:MAG TPA: hypothetical protein VGO92_00920 [Acidimicrobiales bacterium]|nr:hypothetical protein [Acidimicrobiales bacterium]